MLCELFYYICQEIIPRSLSWIRLSAVSGVLIDKWLGLARGAAIFCGLTIVGQVVFGFGGYFRFIWLMNMGRFIFGIGSEALWSVQSVYAAAWFFGKQLNFVFGLQLSFARAVRIITSLAYEMIAKYRP